VVAYRKQSIRSKSRKRHLHPPGSTISFVIPLIDILVKIGIFAKGGSFNVSERLDGLGTDTQEDDGDRRRTLKASDDVGVSHIELFVDGRPVGKLAEPPYRMRFDTSSLTPNVWHIITAAAYDNAGHRSEARQMMQVVATSDAVPEAKR
jgi:hypothetical protein